MSDYDLDHWYSEDLATSATGDISTVSSTIRTQQRIVRAVLTNEATADAPPDYIWHPDYGCGAARYIGETANKLEELRAKIFSQVIQEPGVASTPTPAVEFETTNSTLTIKIKYVDASTGEPQVLQFTA